MVRALLVATAVAASIWGTAIGAPPAGNADPPDINCTQFNEDGSCVYKNCTDAKNHGVCNIPCGDPAYCPGQDRDGDCIACEC